MKPALLDVNVLVAMTWPSHVHHALARRWFLANAAAGWATCPMTQCAFVRISSNARIMEDAVPPQEARRLLQQLIRHAHHVFWPDSLAFVEEDIPAGYLVGHRQVTDAYLLGLALRNGGRLATLDAGVRSLLPANSPLQDAVCLVRE